MSYKPYSGPRAFVIYNGATVNDPAEVTPLREVTGGRVIDYSDFSELKELISKIEARLRGEEK